MPILVDADALFRPAALRVQYGELRRGVWMHGVFATHDLADWDAVGAWSGTVGARDALTEPLWNMHDVVRYWMTADDVFVSPELDEEGRPDPAREFTMAFTNEPSTTDVATIVDNATTLTPGRATSNVCPVNLYDETSQAFWGTVFFAHRAIRVGEEITWCYGASYKRDTWDYHDGFERVSYRIGDCADCALMIAQPREVTLRGSPLRRRPFATKMMIAPQANLTRLFTRMIHLTKLHEHLHDEL